MEYILITPCGTLNAAQTAEAISRELYCLTAPRQFQEEYQHEGKVFPVLIAGNMAALNVQMDWEITIHPGSDIEAYLALWQGTNVADIRQTMTTHNVVAFAQICPVTDVLSESEIVSLGFLQNG
jgi:hypothetical protein